MKVICKETTSRNFNLKEVTTVLSNEFDYTYGGYGLELNKEYIVMGIATYVDSKCLYYLIDINGKPDWFPFLLFDISDNSISSDWKIRINNNIEASDIFSLLGFNELICDITFYDRLQEREKKALDIFNLRILEVVSGS